MEGIGAQGCILPAASEQQNEETAAKLSLHVMPTGQQLKEPHSEVDVGQ